MRRSRPNLGCRATEEKNYSEEVWKQSIFPQLRYYTLGTKNRRKKTQSRYSILGWRFEPETSRKRSGSDRSFNLSLQV